MLEKVNKIILHYGINNQQKKLQEEIFELQEAITIYECEFRDNGYSSYTDELESHIEEEYADVMVLLEQIKTYYDLNEGNITKIITDKIDRQLERIKNERNN